MRKYSNVKRYMPDYRMSISHQDAYMREVKGQGYIDGELYDEMYLDLRSSLLLNIILLVWFIVWVVF